MNINYAREQIATYTAIGEENMAGLNNLLFVVLGYQVKPEIVQDLSNRTVKEVFELTIVELEEIGLTRNQALTLHSCSLLADRYIKEKKNHDLTVRSPEDAADYLMEEMRNLNQEHFVALFLDTKNQLIKKQTLFKGSLNASIVHPRELYREAVKLSAASIIVSHNHPSGSTEASIEDRQVTRRLAEAGKLMGIELLDHIIIGNQKYYSFKEEGLL